MPAPPESASQSELHHTGPRGGTLYSVRYDSVAAACTEMDGFEPNTSVSGGSSASSSAFVCVTCRHDSLLANHDARPPASAVDASPAPPSAADPKICWNAGTAATASVIVANADCGSINELGSTGVDDAVRIACSGDRHAGASNRDRGEVHCIIVLRGLSSRRVHRLPRPQASRRSPFEPQSPGRRAKLQRENVRARGELATSTSKNGVVSAQTRPPPDRTPQCPPEHRQLDPQLLN